MKGTLGIPSIESGLYGGGDDDDDDNEVCDLGFDLDLECVGKAGTKDDDDDDNRDDSLEDEGNDSEEEEEEGVGI